MLLPISYVFAVEVPALPALIGSTGAVPGTYYFFAIFMRCTLLFVSSLGNEICVLFCDCEGCGGLAEKCDAGC